ncbi:MAG TPA: flagellar hook protein FlgE [Syntrophomonadaceae bacterium]|nr:flagellar hook protein FlgE [Syntrophomonadaceae bacterium]
MMRSMYSGVAGLRNHQTRMDVIGNNIANVNTAGYKKSRVVFQDTLYQNMRGGSSPTDARGGTNPMSIGLGMSVASIDQIHTPAPATSTNKTTDLAIDGNGFFIVDNGGQKFYTRAGNFDFDKFGNMYSLANGYRVHGWTADDNWEIDTVKASQPIDISEFKSVSPQATTEMKFSGNLSSDIKMQEGYSETDFELDENQLVITSKEVYDSLGNKEIVYFRFFKYEVDDTSGDPISKWACDISLDSEFSDTPAIIGVDPIVDESVVRVEDLIFNANGVLDSSILQDLVIDRSAHGAENIELDIDFSSLTQWETKSTAWAEHQNGYTMGNLTSYTIGIDGVIQGVYDNGEARNLARVALVNFQNPAGLIQAGGSLFQVSNNSGDPMVGAPGDQGMGALIPGSLEMSNVDLSEEFTDMIITQRGFQANSRIITTSDEMLQELVNLKR